MSRDRTLSARRNLELLFVFSGFAALLYQVAWQRKLFAIIGVDLISVAIIVSIFMLGLGLGALLGGRIADGGGRLVRWFAAIEFAIGIYGFCSTAVIDMSARMVIGTGALGAAVAGFGVLIIPTVLMGSTLPILVIHLDRVLRSIGASTGRLYFLNTMGGAIGTLVAGFLLFKVLTLPQAVAVAASLNLIVAVLAIRIDGVLRA